MVFMIFDSLLPFHLLMNMIRSLYKEVNDKVSMSHITFSNSFKKLSCFKLLQLCFEFKGVSFSWQRSTIDS